ncbi:MAG: multicopper oxidase family protein [Candidatus Nanopelagicales bacterium]
MPLDRSLEAHPISRRQALAGIAGAAALLGLAGQQEALAAGPRDTLPRLRVIRSRAGVLEASFTATTTPARLMGVPTDGLYTYDQQFVAPLLVIDPGDRLSLTVRNRTPIDLNTHLHGFHVTPEGDGDNVFLSVPPGEDLTTRLTIPRDHSRGLNWYHPHVHGVTNESVFKGLAGPFFVRGGVETLPGIRSLVRRLLVVKAHQLVPDVTPPTMVPVANVVSASQVFTVNGALTPNLVMRPGETQLWALANMTPGAFLRLELSGHSFTVLAEDGNPAFVPWSAAELDVPRGSASRCW